MMKGLRVAVAALVAIGTGVGYYLWKQSSPLPYTRQDVVAVWLDPVPDGPGSPRFVTEPNEGDRPLTLIDQSIPSPLPRDVWQGFTCNTGGDVVVEIRNGESIRYGPCRRPGSIEDLRQQILRALQS